MSMRDQRRTIWVIDDSVTDADRVAATLREEFEVKIFHDGVAALELLASSELPDLLLLDWIMPGMSGLEICKYIRSANAQMAQLPIILLTAQYGRDEIAQAFEYGANDYIVKPFVEAELKARVKTLTNSKKNLERVEKLVKQLTQSEERLTLATNSAGVGIWEWDIREGTVASTEIHNKIFELPNDRRVHFKNLMEKIVAEDREDVQKKIDYAIETKSVYACEFRIEKADRSIAWISGHGRAIYNEEKLAITMVGVHLDITAQKNAESELTRAKNQAEQATVMKSAFLANMSHEIRTPLGAMLGFAHLMQDPTITRMEQSQYLEVLARNGEQLSILINDILDLSKVEAGLLVYEHRKFDPAELCKEVISLFKVKAREKNLTLEFISEKLISKTVCTDPDRLRQIIANLVSNAIKFTQFGGVKIVCSESLDDHKRKFLSVEVIDTGIGVPAKQAGRIFDMFVQGDDSITRKFGGTGIGLSLSRQLARELGGDITLKSGPGSNGSAFTVSLRDHQSTQTEHDTTGKTTTTNELTQITFDGTKILVVDDSPDNLSLLSLYLSKRGAVVDTAANGIEGYQKAISHVHDIVLMDLQMPQMDGYATTKKLREMGYSKPIIALTAHAMSEVSARCLEAGCNGYLPKPINPVELMKTIAAHIQ